MGRYDKEKEAMGLKPTSSTSAPKKESKYAKEREAIKTGVKVEKPASVVNKVRASTIMDPINTNLATIADRQLPKVDPFVSSFQESTNRLVKENPKKNPVLDVANKVIGQLNKNIDKSSKGRETVIGSPLAPRDALVRPDADSSIADRLKFTGKILSRSVQDPIAEIGAEVYMPGAGMNTLNQAYQGAGNLVSKIAPKLVNSKVGSFTAERIKDGLVSLPLDLGYAAKTAENNKELAKQTATNLGIGVGFGAVGDLIGKYAPAIIQSLTKRNQVKSSIVPEVEEVTQRVFSDYGKQAGPENADSLIGKIFDEVNQRTTPPLENPKLLYKYVKDNLGDIPDAELRNLSYDDLAELAQEVQKGTSMTDVSRRVAKDLGYDWDDVIKSAELGAKRTEVAPVSRYAKERETIQQAKPSRYAEEREAAKVSPLRKQKLEGEVDELKFAKTVKNSDNTPIELAAKVDEKPMVGARTTDVLNRKQADELITKHGKEGLYAKLLDKKLSLSPAESVAAQKLAKEYASEGGKDNLTKAIALVSKTAREGREMGQAIQALSQWNKMDETGALLMGQRQLNRGVSDTADWIDLTPAQAKPLEDAAEKFGQAQETKSLADEVLSIVTNKQAGEALTDVEKATIKKFQDQVKDIDSKVKGFLPKQQGKAQETIKKIREIEPKSRTRDQVVNFLDAKADLARKRLEKSRNIGIMPDLNNPVTDYAIIGASHIAKGVRNLADYTEIMLKDFGDSVKPHIKAAYNKSVNIYRRENGLPTVEDLDRVVNKAVKDKVLDKETAETLQAIATDIGFYTDKNLKREATQDLQRALKELGSSALGEKLSTLQTGAQLLNFVTIGRNVIGNTAQMATEKLNKMVAVPVDWGFSKLTGERTIKFFPDNQESMFENFMMGGSSGWDNVSVTGTLSSYDVRPDVFGKKNPLRYITKSLGATLQSFDNVAYRAAYGDVVATYAENLGKAQGLTKAQIKEGMPKLIEQLDDQIHKLADDAGLYATFQDETLLSKAADITKKGLNKITDYPMEKLVEMGVLPKKYSTQGFGLGDIVLKYARTPANLVMRGIDYSPLGFLRATMELAPLVFNKSKFNQFEATRALSRAITGTLGLTGMGYTLYKAGVLTGSYSRDKDLRSIEEQSGQGSYKVNWSGLGRFIMSGFDKEAAKFQKGDRLMDYQWLQPTAIALAIGVNFGKAQDEADPDTSGWQVMQRAILGGLSTVLENPMVQGLSNVIDAGTEIIKNQDTSQAKRIVKGVPTTFIPTVLGQARTATDNNQRETRDESILKEMFNLIKNKTPGASKTLPIAYDSLGNERQRLQGGKANTVGQYLKSFFSPAKITKYEVSPDAKLVLDLLEESKDLKILPRMADRGLEVNDPVTGESKRVILSGKEYSQIQKSVGQQTTDMLREYEYFLADPKVSIEEKTAAMSKILTHVGQVARNELRETMGYPQKQMR